MRKQQPLPRSDLPTHSLCLYKATYHSETLSQPKHCPLLIPPCPSMAGAKLRCARHWTPQLRAFTFLARQCRISAIEREPWALATTGISAQATRLRGAGAQHKSPRALTPGVFERHNRNAPSPRHAAPSPFRGQELLLALRTSVPLHLCARQLANWRLGGGGLPLLSLSPSSAAPYAPPYLGRVTSPRLVPIMLVVMLCVMSSQGCSVVACDPWDNGISTLLA